MPLRFLLLNPNLTMKSGLSRLHHIYIYIASIAKIAKSLYITQTIENITTISVLSIVKQSSKREIKRLKPNTNYNFIYLL